MDRAAGLFRRTRLPGLHRGGNTTPQTVGAFKDDDEDKEPCGGYSPSLSDIETVDFHVGGDSIATKSTHPQTNWLYRITTDAIVKNNWTQVYPIVQQSGPGDYCSKAVTIPSSYVGQKAILGIVASGIDGILYQVSRDCVPIHTHMHILSSNCATATTMRDRIEKKVTQPH
ncbi:hypothetical protein NUW58_g8541 [Xylaria curta]|uniref:Uncharacterized protein n=1 Tax=Xylaria curta TaxID=42375 RepID=A0ACC1N740_9PEZI|nr:hypothetical protein NUW58_g8541 [Xylaria curta]